MVRSGFHSVPLLKWKLRAACIDDANTLAMIDATASPHPWSESQFIAICSDLTSSSLNPCSERIQVLVEDDDICGFVVYSQVVGEGSIHSIVVSPLWQGQGKGSLLLQGALDVLSRNGASCCQLEVRESNTVARGMYERFGFHLDGIREKYYPMANGREDALLLSKLLPQP